LALTREGCHEVTGCGFIIAEENTPLTPLKRGIKKTSKIYQLDKEKNQSFYVYILSSKRNGTLYIGEASCFGGL